MATCRPVWLPCCRQRLPKRGVAVLQISMSCACRFHLPPKRQNVNDEKGPVEKTGSWPTTLALCGGTEDNVIDPDSIFKQPAEWVERFVCRSSQRAKADVALPFLQIRPRDLAAQLRPSLASSFSPSEGQRAPG